MPGSVGFSHTRVFMYVFKYSSCTFSTLLPVPCLPIGPSQEIPTRTSAISHLRLSRRSQEVHPAGGGQAKDAGSRHAAAAAAAAAATTAADGLVGHEGGGEEEEQRRGAMNFVDVLLGPKISRKKAKKVMVS